MPSTFAFCLQTSAFSVPYRPVWLHEVKYDSLEREGNRVRLIMRGGSSWSDRYPWIVEVARKNRHQQFVIDGEAVLLTFDGIPDFDALHSRRHDEQVQLYAFDILALDGEDLHELPLSMRKTPLELSRKVQCTGGNSNILSSALGELHYVAETCTRRTHKLTAIEHFVAPLDVLHFAQESASARAGTLAAQERPSGPHDLSLQEP